MTTWTLDVVAAQELHSWAAAARRLRGVLAAISQSIAAAYGRPVTWISGGLDAAGWTDVERIAEDMERQINRDESSRVWHELGAAGAASGYLDGRDLTIVAWTARHERVPMQCIADFWTPNHDGVAKPLAEHDPDWLADLVLDTALAMGGAKHAHIATGAWTRGLIRRGIRERDTVGAVTYAPGPVDPNALPDTLHIARQTEAGTAIVVKDLQRFASDPAWLLDDLLALEQQIGTARAPAG